MSSKRLLKEALYMDHMKLVRQQRKRLNLSHLRFQVTLRLTLTLRNLPDKYRMIELVTIELEINLQLIRLAVRGLTRHLISFFQIIIAIITKAQVQTPRKQIKFLPKQIRTDLTPLKINLETFLRKLNRQGEMLLEGYLQFLNSILSSSRVHH